MRPDTKINIFISYSRADLETADAIAAALEERGFSVPIDRRDLPYGEEWQSESAEFIRLCDTVVWLVSPNSAKSQWCRWESGGVRTRNKRLIPLEVGAVAPEEMPESIGKIHILPAEGAFRLDAHLEPLIATINADRKWIKEHTRLHATRLHERNPEDIERIALSRVLVRLGDLNVFDKNFQAAKTRYDFAFQKIQLAFRASSATLSNKLKREPSWTYNRVGDVNAALKNYVVALSVWPCCGRILNCTAYDSEIQSLH